MVIFKISQNFLLVVGSLVTLVFTQGCGGKPISPTKTPLPSLPGNIIDGFLYFGSDWGEREYFQAQNLMLRIHSKDPSRLPRLSDPKGASILATLADQNMIDQLLEESPRIEVKSGYLLTIQNSLYASAECYRLEGFDREYKHIWAAFLYTLAQHLELLEEEKGHHARYQTILGYALSAVEYTNSIPEEKSAIFQEITSHKTALIQLTSKSNSEQPLRENGGRSLRERDQTVP